MFLEAEFISVSVSPREPSTCGIQVCDSHVQFKKTHSVKKKLFFTSHVKILDNFLNVKTVTTIN